MLTPIPVSFSIVCIQMGFNLAMSVKVQRRWPIPRMPRIYIEPFYMGRPMVVARSVKIGLGPSFVNILAFINVFLLQTHTINPA